MKAFAHRIELAQQSAEIELLIAAGIFAAGAAFLFWRAGGSGPSFTTLGLALVALAAAFVVPWLSGPPGVIPSSDPFLSISEPQPGARLDASEEVQVAVSLKNAPLAGGGKLLLLVDGRAESVATEPRFRFRVSPGEHRLTVRYMPAEGAQTQPIESSIIVTAE